MTAILRRPVRRGPRTRSAPPCRTERVGSSGRVEPAFLTWCSQILPAILEFMSASAPLAGGPDPKAGERGELRGADR